jgi:transposase
VVALTCRATVDVPARFRKSKAVSAVFGLTCSKYQSGEIDPAEYHVAETR